MRSYSDAELLRLLNEIESDNVERKESFSDGDKARQAICAFANDLPNHNNPGVLFVGAKDDGNPSNLPITDKLLLDLSAMKTDGNILPPPVMTIEKRLLNGAEIAVVMVMPSDMPPVRYRGRIWVRIGPRRSIATEQDERISIEKRRYKNKPFDLYPVPDATISDLSRIIFESEYLPKAIAPEVLEANNRTYEEKLASCGMIVSPTDTTPTVLGLLSVGKNPQNIMHGAYIQFLRIDGTELADEVTDEEVIGGAVVNMLQRIEDKLKAHNRRAINVTDAATHKITTHYPLPAVYQIIYNAVQHRAYERTNAPIRVYWFNDRIEVNSPGGPYGNVTPENFGNPGITDYRNPNIGAVMKTFGFIQSFGREIEIARRELKRNGNPSLEFNANENFVRCTIRLKP